MKILQDVHRPADGGIKIGARIPRVIELGTIVGGGRKIFAAVHHDTPIRHALAKSCRASGCRD